ncbi:MAG: class I SAM-dependent methyltransferase [bacterium]
MSIEFFHDKNKKKNEGFCPHAYKGITAQLYDLWFDFDQQYDDLSFYQRHIKQNGGNALEIASGTGRLLLPYIQEGLNVEGLEPSTEMNEICYAKAHQLGLNPVIHEQAMESMKISTSYNTIYIPLYSFQLLVDFPVVYEALRRFYLHLEKDGHLLISLFIPEHVSGAVEGAWRLRRKTDRAEDKVSIILSESVIHNQAEQVQNKWFKYEVYNEKDEVVRSFIRAMSLRWYYRYEFIMMLEKVGFRDVEIHSNYSECQAHIQSQSVVFSARK